MTHLRHAFILAVVLLAFAPIGGADHGGFHYSGTLFGAYATPVASAGNNFLIDLAAGETITVTVEWFDASADLDVFVVPPAGSCTVLPSPDLNCQLSNAGKAPNRVTCPAGNDGRTLLGVSPETLTYTAGVAGQHTLVVAASAGDVVVNGIPYLLSVDGGANVQQPTQQGWLRADACRSV